MKISRIVDLHANAGWRVFSFLKIETDAGLIGWSEYNESYGSKGLTVVIMKLAEMLIGQDPRPVELITANLYARTRQAPGGRLSPTVKTKPKRREARSIASRRTGTISTRQVRSLKTRFWLRSRRWSRRLLIGS